MNVYEVVFLITLLTTVKYSRAKESQFFESRVNKT